MCYHIGTNGSAQEGKTVWKEKAKLIILQHFRWLTLFKSLSHECALVLSISCQLFHMSSSGPCGDANRGNSTRQWVCARIQLPKRETTFAREEMRYPKALQMNTGPFERKLGVKVKHKYFGQDECHKVLDNTF